MNYNRTYNIYNLHNTYKDWLEYNILEVYTHGTPDMLYFNFL